MPSAKNSHPSAHHAFVFMQQESMKATAEANPEKFFIAPSPFTMGTEEAIEAFMNSVAPANMCSIQ